MHGKLGVTSRTASGHIRFTTNVLRSLGIANDVLCLLIAYVFALIVYEISIGYYFDARLHRTGAVILGVNYLLIKVSRDGYTIFRGQGEDLGSTSIADFLLASGLTALVVLQLGMMPEFSRGLGLFFIGFGVVLLFLSQMAFRRLIWILMDRGIVGQRVAIYAPDRAIVSKVNQLLDIERLPHLKIIGYADDRIGSKKSSVDSIQYLGGFDALLELAQSGKLDQVILAWPDIEQDRLDFIAESLSSASIDLCLLPRETTEISTRYKVNFLGSVPVLAIWQQPIRDVDGLLKESIDRLCALIALIVLSPLLLMVAIAIKLESNGPVIFRQKRFGFNNNEISVLKFRSMYVDRQDSTGAKRTEKNDSRVTYVGRLIRRTSIDELPQLVNVLRGDMSLVGPRPHATKMKVGDKYYFDAVKGYAARHRVKPGITGLAQVRGLRGEIATVERARKRVEYDMYYIENWSPLFDIRIILETFVKLVWDKHAY